MKYTDEVKDKAVKLALEGVHLKTIQIECGPNPKAIMRYLKKRGIDYKELLKSLKEQGREPKTALKIAKEQAVERKKRKAEAKKMVQNETKST